MSELTPDREQEIRARRGHIADAPWGSRGDGDGGTTVQAGVYITLDEGFASSGDVAHVVADTPEQSYRRAAFIARAPRDIDDLLAEVDRLRAELAARPARAAVLEAAAVEARAALAALCHDLDDPGTAALGALYLLQQATTWVDTKSDEATRVLAKRDARVIRKAAEDFEERCPDAGGGLELCMCHAADELYRLADAAERDDAGAGEQNA